MSENKNTIKKPFYKRWKFWAITFVVLFIIGSFTPEEVDEAGASKAEELSAEEVAKKEEAQERYEEMKKARGETEKKKAEEKKKEESENAALNREEVNAALSQIADASEGTVLNVYINPYASEGTFSQIHAEVSDAWYHSQEFEKERFAETVYDAIKATLVAEGAISDYDEPIIITLYDGHEKELAKSKLMGGFKIKR